MTMPTISVWTVDGAMSFMVLNVTLIASIPPPGSATILSLLLVVLPALGTLKQRMSAIRGKVFVLLSALNNFK